MSVKPGPNTIQLSHVQSQVREILHLQLDKGIAAQACVTFTRITRDGGTQAAQVLTVSDTAQSIAVFSPLPQQNGGLACRRQLGKRFCLSYSISGLHLSCCNHQPVINLHVPP